MPSRPKIVAFDIIGTLFNLSPLDGPLRDAGLPENAVDLWFAQGLRDSFALAASDCYAPFRSTLAAALDVLLAQHGGDRSAARVAGIFDEMGRLPPHADAAEALRALRGSGIGVMALSNGSAPFVKSLLDASGLGHQVETIVSVDDARCLKPRVEIYRYAARAAGVPPSALALVATHAWDIHGAGTAGLVTGYVARGKPFPPLMRAPDFTGESLGEVAGRLAALA